MPSRWIVRFALILLLVSPQALFAFSATVGQPAPALVLPKLNGDKFDLSSEHGKVVIIHLWASWCPACRAEMPALEELYKRYQADGFNVIAVSADRPRDKSAAVKEMESYTFPAGMLSDASSNGFGSPSSLPTTIIIDRDGIVRDDFTAEETLTLVSLTAAVSPLIGASKATQH